jgi:hypothetical protein
MELVGIEDHPDVGEAAGACLRGNHGDDLAVEVHGQPGPFVRTTSTTTTGVRVNVYRVSSISSSSANSMMTTAKNSLVTHAGRFGSYLYGEADVVLDNNFWFGGMEYPGFVLDVVSSTAHWYGISTTADFKAAAQAATSVNLSSFWTTHRIDG